MKKRISFILLLPLLLLIESCGPLGPRAFHVPQLDSKGDFQAGGYISPSNGLELQVDYAWGERFYTPADFSYSVLKSGENGFRSNAYSLGIGYYRRMNGSGRFNMYYTPMYGNFGNTGSEAKSHFFSHALGSDIGWRFNHFEAAFSMKIEHFSGFNNYWNLDGHSTNLGAGMTMRAGGERVKFHAQMGLSYPVIGDHSLFVFPYVLSLGINYRFNFRG